MGVKNLPSGGSRTRQTCTAGLLFVGLLAACSPAAAPSPTTPAAQVAPSAAPSVASAPIASTGPSASPIAPAQSPSPSASVLPSPASAASSSGPLTVEAALSEISGDALPVWVAQDEGIFQQNNLNVDLQLVSSSNAVAALLSGQVDVAIVGGAAVLSADVNGANLVDAATLAPVYPYVFEATADIQTPDQLKGKKVGVSSIGSSSDVATRIALQKIGLDPDTDVTIVSVGSDTARTSAIVSGAIQGALAHPPQNVIMEQNGMHVLFDLSSLNAPADDAGVSASRTWMTGHRPAMQAFVDSVVQAIHFIKTNEDATKQVIAKEMQLSDPDQIDVTYQYHATHIFPDLPFPATTQFADAQSILAQKDPSVTSFDLTQMLDTSFVQSAQQRGVQNGS